MACIRKRKKRGKWYYVVDSRDAAGVRRMRFFPTKREADDHLTTVGEEKRQKARPVVDVEITVRAYSERWLGIIATQVKPRTLESYTDTLRLHILPALGHVRVQELERGRVKALLAAKSQSGLATNSVRIVYGTLRAMLNAARDDGLRLAHPDPVSRLGRTMRLV